MSTDLLIGRDRDGNKVYVSAEVRRADGQEIPTLALQGVVVRKGGQYARDGDWITCGQIDHDHLRRMSEYAPGWDAASVRRLSEVWDRWHLNTMKAGCEHQRAHEWDKRTIDPNKPSNTYGRHFEGQQQDTWNLWGWIRPSEHPQGLMTKPCPECGYGYGTAWKAEEVPADVLAFVAEHFGVTVAT